MEVSANRFQLVSHNAALQGAANQRFSLAHAHDSVHFGHDEKKEDPNTEAPKDAPPAKVDNKDQKTEPTEQKPAPVEQPATTPPATATVDNLKAFLQEKGSLKKDDATDINKVADAAYEFIKANNKDLLSAEEKSTQAADQLKAAVLKSNDKTDVSSTEKILEATAKLFQDHKILDPAKLTTTEKKGPFKAFGIVGWGGIAGLVAGGLALAAFPPVGIVLLIAGGIATIVGLYKANEARKAAATKPEEKTDKPEQQ